jgi:hypothetical protein
MKIPLGVSLVIAGVAIVLAMAGGAWWWWKDNAEKLQEAGAAAFDEGRQAGAVLRESGCVDKAVERHRVAENRTLLGSVRTNLFLRACLDSSKSEPAFCDGVPAKGEILSTGLWAGQSCVKLGYTDSYCGQMFTQISEYCSSPERASKLRPAAVKP